MPKYKQRVNYILFMVKKIILLCIGIKIIFLVIGALVAHISEDYDKSPELLLPYENAHPE